MFGWFMILSTAVMQKYGLFPNPDVPLQYKDWGAARTVEKGGERAPAVCPGGAPAWLVQPGLRLARGRPSEWGCGARAGACETRVGACSRERVGSLGRARRALVGEPAPPLESPPPSLFTSSPPPLSSAGALSQQGMGTFITNERAIIMIAHIHALTVSAAAAFGPQVSGGVGEGR